MALEAFVTGFEVAARAGYGLGQGLTSRGLHSTGVFGRTFMLSALTGDGVGDLAAWLARSMPPGPWLYPEDEVSDMPAWLLAAEITREKLFWLLQPELPYPVAVQTERVTRGQDASPRTETGRSRRIPRSRAGHRPRPSRPTPMRCNGSPAKCAASAAAIVR